MDWVDLINQSIAIAKKSKKRGSVVNKSKKKRAVIVAESAKEEDAGPARKWEKSAETIDVLSKALEGHFLFEKVRNVG